MRAAVYNRFWHSMGGGERHSGKLAEVLAKDGWKVDLIGHSDVGKDELADHLGLDFSGVELRVVPDRGDEELAALSAEYDLFVNASYMSRLRARGHRNFYLCYFPTPFDHDMSGWRRSVLRTVGPHVTHDLQLNFEHGLGWYPPEGGRRRTWTWTQGDGVLSLAPGVRRKLSCDLGRPGGEPVDLTITDEAGVELAKVRVTPNFTSHEFDFGQSKHGSELHFVSDTFTPGGADTRSLGVAVSRLRLAGSSAGWRGRVVGHAPWLLRNPTDFSFLDSYESVLANSDYTRGWIKRLWKRDAEVLFPPIRVEGIHPRPERAKRIVTVGRFFAPGLGHAKRQLEMVRMFGDFYRAGGFEGWELHVVGGCEKSQVPYLEQVQRAGAGLPVHIHANAPRALVDELLTTSSVFWAATGLGEDEERRPWTMEHFGMTTVEAMAGGCVPVVIDRAGQREIVREGIDGFRWSTPAQLRDRTLQVIGDEALRARLAAEAVVRASDFSEHAFAARWHEIAAKFGLSPE